MQPRSVTSKTHLMHAVTFYFVVTLGFRIRESMYSKILWMLPYCLQDFLFIDFGMNLVFIAGRQSYTQFSKLRHSCRRGHKDENEALRCHLIRMLWLCIVVNSVLITENISVFINLSKFDHDACMKLRHIHYSSPLV